MTREVYFYTKKHINPEFTRIMPKARGRPRAFDDAAARQAILRTFWQKGYAATTLDDLSRATGLVRPSLNGAFGSKRDMYLMSMDTYLEHLHPIREALGTARTARSALEGFFLRSIDVFTKNDDTPQLGCFLVSTAQSDAASDPELQGVLSHRLALFTDMLTSALSKHAPDAKPRDIAFAAEQAAAILHSLAVRARAGDPKAPLATFARRAARIIAETLIKA